VTYILNSTVLGHVRFIQCNRLHPISNRPKVHFETLNHVRVQRLDGVLDLKLIKMLINTEVHIMRGSIAFNGVLDLK